MPFSIFEVLIVVGIIVLLFGAKGAPKIARRLGTGVREMKDAVSDMDPRSVFDADGDNPKPKPTPALEAAPAEAVPAAEPAPVAQAPVHAVIDAELAVPVERLSTDDPPRPTAAG